MRRKTALFLVFALMLGTLSGCGGNKDKVKTPTAENEKEVEKKDEAKEKEVSEKPVEEVAESSGVFNNYFTGDIDTINPHIYTMSNSATVFGLATMRLYVQKPNEDGESFSLVGELADGDPKKMDDEGKVWQIKIKENGKWENGDLINIDDLIYSWQMCLDPILINTRASQLASDYITIENAVDYYLQGDAETTSWEDVGIKRIDDYTLELLLTDPVTADDVKNHFNYAWTSLVHKDTYEAGMDADRTKTTYGANADQFMSNGRFILKTWVPSSQVILEKNPDYVDADETKLAGYTLKMLEDSNTALELFLAGDLDVVNLNASVIEQYIDDPRVQVAPATSIQSIVINHGNTDNNGILSNLNFRKALFHAVDRGTVAKMTNGIPANYIVPQKCLGDQEKGLTFRNMPESQEYLDDNYSYDPEKAKEYFDLALEEVGLSELSLTLMYNEASANNKAISEFLHKQLPEIFGDNFTLNLQGGSSSILTTYVQGWREGDPNSFELQWRGWNTSTPAPWNGLKVYSSSYSNKNEPYFNEEFDELWEIANNGLEAKLDPAYRLELTRDMEKMLLEDVATVSVYEAPGYYLINERVKLPGKGYIPGYGFGYPLSQIVE